MPRYRVTEIRARKAVYLIDAADEKAAERGDGEILDEGGDADDYGQELVSVERVDNDETEAGA